MVHYLRSSIIMYREQKLEKSSRAHILTAIVKQSEAGPGLQKSVVGESVSTRPDAE